MKKMFLILSVYLAIVLSLFLPSFAFSQTESMTIVTYYPAPFGVYIQLRLLRQDTHQEIQLNSDAGGNPNIELRYLEAVPPLGSGTPYIDFSNDPASDFDYRLQLMGDNDFRFTGGTASFADNSGNYGPIRAGEFWICSGAVTAP